MISLLCVDGSVKVPKPCLPNPRKTADISWDVMQLVLEHIYRDAGMSLFQSVERPNPAQYIEHTVQILAVANELLLDKLKLASRPKRCG
jgi:hypothetical protein